MVNNNEDEANWKEQVMPPILFFFLKKKRKSPPGICVTVKAPLTEAGGYHRGKSACSSLRVPPLKQLNKESLTAPSTGILV